jgi:hypothetical protein
MPKGLKAKLQKAKAAAQRVQAIAKDVKKIEQIANSPMYHLGGAVGKRFGHQKIGQGAGRFLGKIMGTGDYVVNSNSIAKTSAVSGDAVPQFRAGGKRGVRITHREFLGDIITSNDGSFAITQYPLNPGLYTTFPWLSVLSAQFDQWKPNGIVACFKSTASTYSGTAALGTVVMATDYDPDDPAYVNKLEMENSQFAVSGSAAENIIHPVECALNERPVKVLYTRQGAISTDKRFYDLGNLYVATVGCAPNTNIGELWITYDITFFKEQLYGGILGRTLVQSLFRATSFDNTAPFGLTQTQDDNNSFQVSVAGAAITFPFTVNRGTFLVCCYWNGNAAASDVGVTYTSGCAAGPKLWHYPTSGTLSSLIKNTGTDNDFILCFTVSLTAPTSFTAQTVTLNSISLPTAGGNVAVSISQLNPNVTW